MKADGNKKPKKEKTSKHEKHVPAYEADEAKTEVDVFKKKK